MDKNRLEKLESVVKKLVGEFLLEDIKNIEENFGLISIVGVKISIDISYLDIFVSSFKNSDKLTKTLAGYSKELTKKLHKSLTLRKFPRIRFRYDKSGEISDGILKTINKL